MVYSTAGVFLGATLANVLTQIDKANGGKSSVVVVNTPESEILKKLIPIARFSGYQVCGAGADMLPSDLEPMNNVYPSLFRIQVALTVAGVFSATIKLGSDSATYKLNSGVALVASCLYIFDVLVHPNDKINFQSSLAGTANLRIQEITLGVQ